MAPSTEDWRDWVLHVSDDIGEEIFCLPFASLLGKPHLRGRHVCHVIDAASAAPEYDHDAVAQAVPNCLQSLSARASLHARARPEVVRQASAPRR